MASTADRLLGEALKLAPEERAKIVAELLATLEPDLPSERRSEGKWIQEIERRARAAIAGSPGVGRRCPRGFATWSSLTPAKSSESRSRARRCVRPLVAPANSFD